MTVPTTGRSDASPDLIERDPGSASEWWRTAVIYQIYPRSFADSDGDGIGDLPGITSRLDALAELGVDAIWLSPFMVSPQRDAGYDVADFCDVDPIFGSLEDFDALVARAHELGIRVIVDLVPNHSSSEHPWFRAALAAQEGSAERGRYIFRDGRGEHGELPPNNWQSVFGGPAWTRVTEADGAPGQWYLHLFDSTQPDFDWTSTEVREEFIRILRFWLDRGADGFRIDVAHGLVKAEGLPDIDPDADGDAMDAGGADSPYWGQPGVHEIYREWRTVADSYDGDRVLAAEAWMSTTTRTALWVRHDELHQAFNFPYLMAPWSAPTLRAVIDDSLRAFGGVGAPSTWVLSNHDVVRHASRLAIEFENPQGHGIGPASPTIDAARGARRARAATMLMLALPGSAYLFQGEELGLPEVVDLPDDARHDPTWHRTNGERYGRDGCRVPLPWEAGAPAAGFSGTGASWLPQPDGWDQYARDRQRGDDGSSLELYRALLAVRRRYRLAQGAVEWIDPGSPDVLAFRNGDALVIVNFGSVPVARPDGVVLASSGPVEPGVIAPDAALWLEVGTAG